MPSSNHSPYGMDKVASPFGNLDDEHPSLPSSQMDNTDNNSRTTRAPCSALDSPSAAAFLATHHHSSPNSENSGPKKSPNVTCNRLNNGDNNTNPGTSPYPETQRRLSDSNVHSSGFTEALLTSVSPQRQMCEPTLPPINPLSGAGVTSDKKSSANQEIQQPHPSAPERIASPNTGHSPSEVQRQTSMESVPDGRDATLPRTATRRTVGFPYTPEGDVAPPTTAISEQTSILRQTSNGFSSTHTSVLSISNTCGTQCLSGAKTPSATILKQEDPALIQSGKEASRSVVTEPAGRHSNDDKDGDEGEGNTQSFSHNRHNKTYANLVISKPNTSEVLETFTATLPGADTRDEGQIRAAGTLNSARMPVFDRAKQVLFTPSLVNVRSPRLRHGRINSSKEGGLVDLSNGANSNNSATPMSARRYLSTLITPLLRTPIHRQQTSGISSPLIVDLSVLEEPARSPATFGNRLKELDGDDDKAVKTHMVWQIREGQTRWTLLPSFLLISVNDRVCIHWYDNAEEVFETDKTYLNVVPGGRHSCYNAACATSEEGGNAEAFEMHNVWNEAESTRDGTTSHVNMIARKPQSNKSEQNPRTKGSSTPLVIRVRTPRPERMDSLDGPLSMRNSVAGTPGIAREAVRARRLAPEVFVTREEGNSCNEASNRVTLHDDLNVPETNLFANSITPLISGHSRQPSSNWLLQRSATRQLLSENYHSFTVSFPKPGDYYFVCSKHKRTMQLHVQVQSKRSQTHWRYVFVVSAGILVVALIVIVVVVLAYWLQKSTYIFSEKESATYEQYIAFLDVHDLITMKLFPFLATGIIIVLFVILAAIGWAVYRCFRPAWQGAYTRGVYSSVHRVLVFGTILLTVALIVLMFVAFGLEINVMNGVNNLALSIGTSLTDTLNLYSTAALQVNYIVNETSTLFPSISLPSAEIFNITSEVSHLISQIAKWTSFVENIAQVAFRVIPIVIFAATQLGAFAACLNTGSVILRCRKVAVATTWILVASLGISSIVCGIEFAVTKLLSNIYSSVVVLRDDPSEFGQKLRFANDSFVSELFSYCTITIDDVSVISDYVNEILETINSTLDERGQKEFGSVFQFIHDVVPTTLEALENYTAYITANLDVLQNILDSQGAHADDMIHKNVIPLLQAIVSVIRTFEGIVNCQVIRDIIATAIPVFRREVENYNTAVFSFLLIAFGVSLVLCFFSVGATYAICNPRRTWCNMRSGRWFRFRYSYKTHISTVMRGAKIKTELKGIVQSFLDRTEPLMHKLQTVKLVCYSACSLMFFDSILIVLFNEVSRGTRTSKMLQALSYLGCAVLFFLLLAALFRRAFIRWILHFCSLLCAAACLGVAVSQAIIGFVYFGQCMDHTRYEMSSLIYGSPVYITCSATYMGYNLEVAIYAIIVFLNSITVVVTLAMQIRYERNLEASFQHRHYIGVLSPLEKIFPWLKCIFADYLFVKRIFYSFLMFVIVLFLVLFALLDIGQWSVIRGVTKHTLRDSNIVQVIDPNVGCNGDSKYCDLRVNEIIWACAHNAHSSLEDGFVLPNHYYNITHQLAAGIRSFMVDVWYDKINSSISDEEDVYVCHMVCLMGRRRWRDVALEFKEFLDKHPKQLIMIIFEQYVNSSDLGKISDEVGLTQYVWYSDQVAPNFNPHYEWPTLQQLINKNQRAMMFNDEIAAAPQSKDCPEWLYYSFDYQYENSYTMVSVSDWVCDIDRGWCTPDPVDVNCTDPENENNTECIDSFSSSLWNEERDSLSDSRNAYLASIDITNCTEYGASPLWKNGSAVYNKAFHTNPPNVRSKMSTMNHFITNGAASPVAATEANQVVQVQSMTYTCSSTWNMVVNILAFDFWNIANPLGTIQAMNQNIARYGKRYNFQDNWSRILFGKDTVPFHDNRGKEQ